MSDLTQNFHNNTKSTKPRLGRGLGSLLSGVDTQDTTGRPNIGSDQDSPVPQAKSLANNQTNQTNQTASQLKTLENIQTRQNSEVDKQHLDVNHRRDTETIPETARIWTLSIEKLSPNKQQPRQIFDDQPLKELAQSIKEKGILQPITARRLSGTSFEIIAGERRWRAAQLAGLKEVPVILKEVSEQDSLELAILENIQRADLNPIEEAEAYDQLLKLYSQTQAQVADRLGKERSTVANAVRLLVLPPEVKKMISAGTLTSGHAKVLLGLESSADQIAVAKETVAEKYSVRALERKVQELKSKSSHSGKPLKTQLGPDVAEQLVEALASELQKLIGTRVMIDYANRKGKLSVYFHSDEQLTEIVERMRKGWAKSNINQTVSSQS